MKLMFRLFTAFLMVFVLTITGFAQRRGSFSGGSGGFHSNSSFSSSRPSGSFSSSLGQRSGSSRSTYSSPRSTGSFNRSSYSRRITISPRSTTTYSYRTNFRVGYRPSIGIHYYGHPYLWGGRSIYWYGGGYYSYGPGMPLYLGTPSMPGYASAYNYVDNSFTNTGAAALGIQPTPVVVYQPNPLYYVFGVFFAILIVVLIIKAIT